ncbi:MAG: S-methyl-5'-thioadenosine phosphorylase, partial [Deltaproteobacteria bacterium]|nr:S-methyl-5'-thioadenosine phosphorylase [Deltaproteobacteria bacterium]
MAGKVVGVIGGSGLYDMDGLKKVRPVKVSTPFGRPSDDYVTGMLGDVKMVFLPRHGRGHKLLPSELNYRANIYGMKKLGVEWIISVSAVGSMKEEIRPGHIV